MVFFRELYLFMSDKTFYRIPAVHCLRMCRVWLMVRPSGLAFLLDDIMALLTRKLGLLQFQSLWFSRVGEEDAGTCSNPVVFVRFCRRFIKAVVDDVVQ